MLDSRYTQILELRKKEHYFWDLVHHELLQVENSTRGLVEKGVYMAYNPVTKENAVIF